MSLADGGPCTEFAGKLIKQTDKAYAEAEASLGRVPGSLLP